MISQNKLHELFKQFTEKNILIIGDVMIDAYLWGKVDRISPEAPVPIIDCNTRENRLGGAGNVALNIQSLGATPVLCSVVGDDDKSNILRQLMAEKNLPTTGLFTDAGRPTTTKTRIISNHQQLLRVDQEITKELSPEPEKQFIEQIIQIINSSTIDAIIFQDYDKGAITKGLIENIVTLANKKGIPTLVDPKKRNYTSYNNVTLFKPNFKELTEGLKIDLKKSDFETIVKVANAFRADKNIDQLLITLSELGVIITNGKEHVHLPAEIRDIADVSGAGDTVISMAALCLASDLSMEQTAWLANFAGGLVCEKVGVVPITTETIVMNL